MNTPWGKADHQKKLAEGVYWVSTPSHGGLVINESIATKYLTPEAIKAAEQFGSLLCFEEDCACAIPFFECPSWLDMLGASADNPDHEFLTLSRWYPGYLISRGIVPSPEPYRCYRADKLADKMRAKKHRNLIIEAMGDWHTGRPGVVEVVTADGKRHFVTEASYRNRDSLLNLLSACVLVK